MTRAKTLADLTATEAGAKLASGEITSLALVDACLARIDDLEGDVAAWVYLDPEHARGQAREIDRRRSEGELLPPLAGVPVGIKDIIDTADMPTQNNCDHFIGHQPEADASVVATLRAQGLVIMGKTVTTELAMRKPGPTRNPLNLEHTPGGSSSGSAAAVACGMVPLALGTQTGGSVIRPASFCGIHAIKPTLGFISRTGVTLQSHTLDTVGAYARSMDDLRLFLAAMDQHDATDDVSYPRAASPLAGVEERPAFETAPKFAWCRTPSWPQAHKVAQSALETFVAGLSFDVPELDLGDGFGEINDHHTTVQYSENAFHFAGLKKKDPTKLSDEMLQALAVGEATPANRYLEATMARDPLYRSLDRHLDQYDAIVCLSATGAAPKGISWTGDPIFNGLWTYLGVPVVSLPLLEVEGLPLGVSLVGKRRGEARLLAAAAAFERMVRD
ncbi:MAG: amidase [Pseudomonadota bacterium]